MHIDITTALACSFDDAVEHVKTTRLLEFVAAPLVRFTPVNSPNFPKSWTEGTYRVRMRLLGLVPIGGHSIVISMPPTDTGFIMRDAGHGALIKTWDHVITITPLAHGALYRDQVEVKAGVLTPFIWLFAQLFYRHRQRRWRTLVARGFEYGDA